MISADQKFIVFTWGCQMNDDDSEQIANLLMQMGYTPTAQQEEADVAFLVTCSVRAKPEEKAKSKLGELRDIKKTRPNMVIGVCGCMAQREGEKLRKGRPFVDMVIGTAQISRIPEILCEIRQRRRFTSALDLPRSPGDELHLPERIARTGRSIKSFVPVMYGCDNFCAYCVVPLVRGRERSRPVQEIIDEVTALAGAGRREVTLLGQNVNSYGAGLDHPADFADLLRAVSRVRGIDRIRFTTSHPKDLSDELIDALRELPNVCEHIHLAVQSGDDEVLRRMNRRHSSGRFRERVAALRQAVPGIAITTDFLVGFPGETEEQFANTMRLAEEVRFDSAFMFAFNPIAETAAATMPGQLSKEVKNERLGRLIELQNRITCEINSQHVGEVAQVLVEGASPRDASRLTGLTRQNKTVNFPGDPRTIGELVDVRLTEGHLYGFVAEPIEGRRAAAGGE